MSETTSWKTRRILIGIYGAALLYFILKQLYYAVYVGGYPDQISHISYIIEMCRNPSPVPDFVNMPVFYVWRWEGLTEYMYQLEGSVAGLADGWILVENHSSDDPCLMALNDWEVYATGENEGYIAITFNTWGLRNRLWSSYDLFGDKPFLVDAGEANLRFNLRFLLRDRQSVCCFHIDAGNQVYVFPNEYALSVDLRGVLSGDKIPTLPYVEAANGVDLGGVVVPWEDGADVNVNF